MQSESEDQIEIKLNSSVGDYRIPGFSEGYAVYLNGCDKGAGYTGALLLLLGFSIAALAIGALVFGSSTITYYRSAGPSWFQYVQMYAGPIMTAGGALFTLGGYLYSKKPMGREAFLLTICKLIAPNGQIVTGTVHIRYLGGDDFNIEVG
ncbi:hypothetical protein [Pseudomonas sp. Kh13]|uniref:hypothetical protein n=1 Tax=Pseudomonas sp. Kh13 TaxID=2093744 RepID=UPI00118332C5|nr:hypothetical protein [Pseudomonas sp. Kh13]